MKNLPETYKKLIVNQFTDGVYDYPVISVTNAKCTDSAAFYIINGELAPFGSTPVLHPWRKHVRALAEKAELI
jgi:hypothetical protein